MLRYNWMCFCVCIIELCAINIILVLVCRCCRIQDAHLLETRNLYLPKDCVRVVRVKLGLRESLKLSAPSLHDDVASPHSGATVLRKN